MKGLKKIHLTAIALAVAQFACATAYAATSSTQEGGVTARMVFKHPQCLQGDGNSFLSASPQTNVNTEEQKQKLAVAYVREIQNIFNLDALHATGIVANLLWESGLNSGMKGTGSLGEEKMHGDASDEKGYGIAQWTKDRKAKLIDLAENMKIPASSQCANFNHLGNELIFDERFVPVLRKVRLEHNLVGSVCAFEKLYQMPKDPNSQGRIELAKNIMTWLGSWEGSYSLGLGSASGDACDYFPGPQPDDTSASPPLGKDLTSDGPSEVAPPKVPPPKTPLTPPTATEADHGPIPVDDTGRMCISKHGILADYGPCPKKENGPGPGPDHDHQQHVWQSPFGNPSGKVSPPKKENGPGPGPDHDHQQHVWQSPFGNPSGK